MDANKKRSLEVALAQIKKRFGEGAAMMLGDRGNVKIDVVSTGSLGLDLALGVGGLPRGRIVEIYGPEASGKTSLALSTIAHAQQNGGNAAFVDAEHALDPARARSLGVNTDELVLSQPDTGDQALEIVETLVSSNAFDVIVIDSVAALVPRSEIEGDMGDASMGVHARLMSQAMRKLTPVVSKSNCLVIFINQIRLKIGVMFGNPETTTGGQALKFYSSVRLEVRKIQSLTAGQDAYGTRVRVKVVKNKVAPPFKMAEFDLLFNAGIDRMQEIVSYASKFDVIKKAGSWYSYKDQKMGQGEKAAMEYLEKNPEIKQEIEEKVMAKITQDGTIEKFTPDENGVTDDTVDYTEEESNE
jgi:recombination protein RecA